MEARSDKHGQFWGKELGLSRHRVAIEDEFNRYLMEIMPPQTEEPKQEPESVATEETAGDEATAPV